MGLGLSLVRENPGPDRWLFGFLDTVFLSQTACLQPGCLPTGQVHCLLLSFYQGDSVFLYPTALGIISLSGPGSPSFCGFPGGLGGIGGLFRLWAPEEQTCCPSEQLSGEKQGGGCT